jgi:hypothetical protein
LRGVPARPHSLFRNQKIFNLLLTAEQYAAPEIVAGNAIQKDRLGGCERANKDPEKFWIITRPDFLGARSGIAFRIGRRTAPS